MENEQRNKAHKNKTVGSKAAKRDEVRKRKAGIDLQPNRGTNIKAFQGPSAGSHKAQKFFRSVEKRETALHVPTVDKTLKHVVEEPPLLVAVVGPPGVGKTTMIRSMIRFYSGRNLQSVRGPITVMAGRSRRITFLEVPNSLAAMCDAAKVADLILLMVDGSYGFEMETFEFLNIAQVHGFPKMFGIVSHLDKLRTGKALKKRKKFLRHRFWHEVAAGAKLLCLSPMIRGQYRPTDVLNLHRLLLCVEPKTQAWRNTHSCVLVDRQEDVTDPDLVAQQPNISRTIAFYGYTRGKPMKANQLIHIPGLGDFPVHHLSHQPDPCQSESLSAGKSQGHRMRHLSTKQKKLYAPYCDVGGISYDDDAIYVQEDAEKGRIERSGEGLRLLRELQRAQPMDAARTHLGVVGGDATATATRDRRPVVFRNEETMELEMDEVRVPSDSDSDSNEDVDSDSDAGVTSGGIVDARKLPKLSEFGLPRGDATANEAESSGDEENNAEGTDGLAPRMHNDPDSIRVNTIAHDWSDARLLKLLKNLCVTGDWKAGDASDGDEAAGADGDEENSKGYESEDAEFEAEARGDKPLTRHGATDSETDSGPSNDAEDDADDASDSSGEGMSEAKAQSVLRDLSSAGKAGRHTNALAGVGYKDTRMNTISATTAAGVSLSASHVNGEDDGWGAFFLKSDDASSSPRKAGANAGSDKGQAGSGKGEDKAEYDILAEAEDENNAEGGTSERDFIDDDSDLNHLVASFLTGERVGSSSGTKVKVEDEDGIEFYNEKAHLNKPRSFTGGISGGPNGNTGDSLEEDADMEATVKSGGKLSEEQERVLKRKMDKKKAFDEDYDMGSAGGKSNTYSYYNQLNRKAAEKKEMIDEALDEVGDDVERKIQLVGYFSGLYVRFVVENVPVEYLRHFDPSLPIIAGGVNAGEDEFRVVHARIKRHRWYPKILKAQDPILLSIGWRRIQTQPIFATEDPNGRNRYLKYTPMHMHCLAAFYAPVTPPNTGFLAIPVRNQRTSNFRISCTGYTIGNDVSASIVKKLKLTGTPAKVEKTNAFIKGMFSSDIEASKFVGAKVKSVSGIRGIIKSVMKGKQGLVRATFEDKIFLSDIVFIRSWKSVDPPKYCSIQRNLLDPEWVGMRTMRELRWDYNVPIPQQRDSEYHEIKRRHRGDEDEEEHQQQKAGGAGGVLISRNMRMQLPYDMKEEFIPLHQTSELQERLRGATAVAPEPREQRRQALLDTFEDKADGMTKKREAAKKRARERAAKEAERESETYLQGLKKAKKETARRNEFRSQHKSRNK